MSVSKNINLSLVLVQPRKTGPFITERLLMGRKNQIKQTIKKSHTDIWALMQENLSSVVCEQQRRRPAYASVQSDQGFCYSLFGKHNIKTCYKQSFTILASLCS